MRSSAWRSRTATGSIRRMGWWRSAKRAAECVPLMLVRSIGRSVRSVLLVLLGAVSLLVGLARQQVEGVALGVGILLVVGGFHLIMVAIEVEREGRGSAE